MALPWLAGVEAADPDGADVGAARRERPAVDAAADDVGVHAGAGDVLAHRVDDEDVDAREGERRHQRARLGEERRFAIGNRLGRDRLDAGELVQAVLDDADRGDQLHVGQRHLGDRGQHGLEAEASGGAVARGRAFRSAEADGRHLQDAAAEARALEVGVRLDAVDQDHAVGGHRLFRDVDGRARRRAGRPAACPCAAGPARRPWPR